MNRDKSHNATTEDNCSSRPKPALDAARDAGEVTIFNPSAIATEKNAWGYIDHEWITASVDDTVSKEEMQ